MNDTSLCCACGTARHGMTRRCIIIVVGRHNTTRRSDRTIGRHARHDVDGYENGHWVETILLRAYIKYKNTITLYINIMLHSFVYFFQQILSSPLLRRQQRWLCWQQKINYLLLLLIPSWLDNGHSTVLSNDGRTPGPALE